MKNIIVRSLSGAVYVGLIVASLVWGHSMAYPLVCALLAAAGIIEINKLSLGPVNGKARKALLAADVIGTVSVFAAATCLLSAGHSIAVTSIAAICTPIAYIYFIIRPIIQIYAPSQHPLKSLLTSFGGYVYVVCPLLSSIGICILFGPGILLALFLMIWCNDTGAYLSGVTIGRHKLCQRISPKKTWEGFFGGMILCTAAAIAAYYWFSGPLSLSSNIFKPLELWQMITIGITVSIIATWGDLVESQLKRSVSVKDSGHIIPGHGGILDRIDSLLLVMPWALLLLTLYS